jgi:hypothetical protein
VLVPTAQLDSLLLMEELVDGNHNQLLLVNHAQIIKFVMLEVDVHHAQLDRSLWTRLIVYNHHHKKLFAVLVNEESQTTFVKLVDLILIYLSTAVIAYNVLLVCMLPLTDNVKTVTLALSLKTVELVLKIF